ncbi:unnamed protein product [Malus baccata var. baccata]
MIMFMILPNIWLGTLLLERSEDIYRMKGLLSVQGMNERWSSRESMIYSKAHLIGCGAPTSQRTNRIVFVGKNLDAQELEKGFKGCLP